MTHSLASQVFCLGSLVDQQGSSGIVVHRRWSRTCVSEYVVSVAGETWRHPGMPVHGPEGTLSKRKPLCPVYTQHL